MTGLALSILLVVLNEANSVPTLNLGCEIKEKKAGTLIRQPLPKKVKLKEIMMLMMKMM